MRLPSSLPVLLLASCYLAFSGDAARAKDGQLDFVSNGRQWPAQVRYKAELPGGAVFLTNAGFTYSYYSLQDLARIHELKHAGQSLTDVGDELVHWHSYTVSLPGCDTRSLNRPKSKLPNYYNYVLGNDPSRWSGELAAYEAVEYGQIYKGIDLQVYSQRNSLKYDFVIAPGASPSIIRLAFNGVTPIIAASGDLLIRTSVNEIRERAPYAYQEIDGRRRQVTCRYVLNDGVVSFVFPQGYDRSKTLVIDPVLVFATYSGSTSNSFGWSATYDTAGNLYAGAENFATGWPVSTGAFKTTFGGIIDVGINKYSSNGNALIYSTYYGGNAGDYPNTMVINAAGELVISGVTRSTNLPVTGGCFDNSYNGGAEDLYVVHFNASGSGLVGATYLGGTGNEGSVSTGISYDRNRGEVVTDSAGNIYIAFATTSGNFPITSGAYQTALNGSMDGIVAKLDGACSNLLFCTYLGGSGGDAAFALQLSKTGKIIVGGGTTSSDFPGSATGWQSSQQGKTDGFIAILNATASSLLHATYVGTSDSDDVAKLQLDPSFNIYAAGRAKGGTLPVSPGAYRVANGRNYVCKLDSTLSNRLLSTTIGDDTSALFTSAFLHDVCGNIYFVGYGAPAGMVTTNDAYKKAHGGFWMCVLNPNMSSLSYASYFGVPGDHIDGGSSRLDPAGIVYHAICTNSNTVPTNSSVWSPAKQCSGYDVASWKFNFQHAGMKARFDIGPEDTFCAPATVSFNNTSFGALSYLWNFGDGSPNSSLHTPPAHTYAVPGIYRITLYTYNVIACKPVDSDAHIIYVFERDTVRLAPPAPLTLCRNDSARMVVKSNWTISVAPTAGTRYQPTGGTDIFFNPDTTTTYQVIASNANPCSTPASDTIVFTIVRDTSFAAHINPVTDTLLCAGDTAVYLLDFRPDHFSIKPADHVQISADSLTLLFYPPATTRYQIIASKANKCTTFRDTLNFNVHRSTLKAAFELSPRLTDQREPEFRLMNMSKGAIAYKWYLNDQYWTAQKSPVFSANDTGTYCFMLEAADAYGCVDTAVDCGRLIETRIYVPSAFSPNGDGKNDRFRPIVNNVSIMEFSVYNRFGERIFVGYDESHSWDGNYHGKPCDLGTYFYSVRYNILNRDPVLLKGDVTLIR